MSGSIFSNNDGSFLLGRRRFLAVTAGLGVTPLAGRGVWAFSSEVHKTMIGDIELSVISDGHLELPAAVFAPPTDATDFDALLTEAFGSASETIMPETNHAILKTGSDLVLVDNGSGNKFQPTAGKLKDNLALNGIDPAAITKVVFTHGHPDHVWGTLLDDGSLFLPNATYYVGGTEYDFWTSPDTLAALPDDLKPFALGAARDFAAVQDRMVRVAGGDEVAVGVSVLDTPGHTPGHIALLVEGGDGMIISGDAIPNQVINVAHPDWAFAYDTAPDVAITTRKALLDRAATDRQPLLGYHFAWPGIGFVERKDSAFRFVSDLG